MGLVLGRVTEETPKFELEKKTEDYEIRRYLPYVVAEVTYSGDHQSVSAYEVIPAHLP